MAQKTVLDFPEIVDSSRDDILYLIRGTGSDRDKRSRVVPVLNNLIYSVSTQDEFNALIERVSANQYQFKDDVRAVLLKYTGGFAMYDGSSPLSGGDTWGNLETNNVNILLAEQDTPINFGGTQGILVVNTPFAYLQGVHVRGNISLSIDAADSKGIEIQSSAIRARLYNCKVSNKKIGYGRDFVAFSGSNTSNDATVHLENCIVETIRGRNDFTTEDVRGFQYLDNLVNCTVRDIIIIHAPNKICYGFDTCNNLQGCILKDISINQYPRGFINCNYLSNCRVENVIGDTAVPYGFFNCSHLSNCTAYELGTISDPAWRARGFSNCDYLTNCKMQYMYISPPPAGLREAYGFYQCNNVAMGYANEIHVVDGNSVPAVGFRECEMLSNCKAENIDCVTDGGAAGFYLCDILSCCKAIEIDVTGIAGGNAYGFTNCNYMSACVANDIDVAGTGIANGFASCEYGSSLFSNEPLNANNDWMTTNDPQIANKFSTPSIWT